MHFVWTNRRRPSSSAGGAGAPTLGTASDTAGTGRDRTSPARRDHIMHYYTSTTTKERWSQHGQNDTPPTSHLEVKVQRAASCCCSCRSTDSETQHKPLLKAKEGQGKGKQQQFHQKARTSGSSRLRRVLSAPSCNIRSRCTFIAAAHATCCRFPPTPPAPELSSAPSAFKARPYSYFLQT